MFTIDQIKTAHGKVKSGADFPAYIREIKKLGVMGYETFVSDGHTDYTGSDDYKTSSPAKYEFLAIGNDCNEKAFQSGLKEHQEGKSDYMDFIEMSAKMGIEKWAVSIEKMTCTYFDKLGSEVLVENIPQ